MTVLSVCLPRKALLTIYPQEIADLVTFTEEIRNGKLDILCSVS